MVARPSAGTADRHLAATLLAELGPLRAVADAAPFLIWQCDSEGQVIWSNRAYRSMAEALRRDGEVEPLMPMPDQVSPGGTGLVRARLTLSDGRDSWYELSAAPQGDTQLVFANCIDAVVRAEQAQRNFVQTLTKTFAHLPIGLAVFDRNRQLALFNPALIDLTALSAEFLSGRPNLMTFFDHMREARMMPEPKNYSSWRERLADLVKAAEGDRYSETWTLPSGLTYKITGRPHPDGAVAFLLEDISAEISLTRRFRDELGQSQAVLDSLPDAVSVFSKLGILTVSNAAYRKYWGSDPDERFADVTVSEERQHWRAACGDSPVWVEICDSVFGTNDRDAWSADVAHPRLGSVRAHVSPVTGGNTMIRFAPEHAATTVPKLGNSAVA
ncbi:MAG: PAS-domain containing protein [Roseivivax sp.]|nr:PAS-domain containing protein [Roseivivax sp.]